MKYCTNCGRQLADDEVCTCRQQAQPQAPNQTQDNNAQADNAAQQGQFNGQSQGSAQAQFNGQPQGSAQSQAFDNFTQQVSAAGQQLQNDKNVASIITFYKGLVKKPAQAAADFVKNANMASGFIFIGLFAIVEVVLSVVYLLSSVIGSIGGFGFSFYPASFFEGIFSGIVGEAVRVLILAAVILVVLNAVQKDKKVTFAQTLSAACLYDAVYLPIILVAAIIDIIPFQFFEIQIPSFRKVFESFYFSIFGFLKVIKLILTIKIINIFFSLTALVNRGLINPANSASENPFLFLSRCFFSR